MRRLLSILALLSLALPSASAAISAKPMVQITQVDPAATGVISYGSQLMVFGSHDKSGFAQFINGPTVELNCGVESFVSAASVDNAGNFYLVGAASKPIVGTLPPINGVLNPDNVVPDPVSSNKSDANTLCYWKLDANGAIIDSASIQMPDVIIPYYAIADKFGLTIAGANYSNPGFSAFIMNWNGASVKIGKSSTLIYGIARSSDGGVVAVGQSGEKLLDRNLKGKSDGFLAKVSNGKLISVQRSSNSNANRAWKSITSNLVLGGYSNSNAVITKFGSSFNPIWTSRYPAIGSALTASAGRNTYGAFVSAGQFKTLPTWKRKGSILVLTFDSKGAISAANYVNSDKFDGFTANSSLGAIVLAGGFLYRT